MEIEQHIPASTSRSASRSMAEFLHSTRFPPRNQIVTKSNSNEPNGWLRIRMKSMKIPALIFLLYTILVLIIGVLIVYFTSPKPNRQCENSFRRMTTSSIISSSNPRSVAVGHLNNDHHLDIVVANSGTNTIGIFLSNDNGTFEDQRTISTGLESRPTCVVVCHINNDEYLDLVVANYLNNNMGIFLGNGNGTFNDQMIFSVGSSRPLFVTFGDLNNDNNTDLVVVNAGTHSIGILLGYGNGSFHHPQMYSTGYDSYPSHVGIAHFNEDHYLDLAVTNSVTDNIAIFLGIGNGSFSYHSILSTNHGSNPSSLVIADMNNDAYLDIVVAKNGTGNIGIFLGHGNGSFQSELSYSIDSHCHPQYISIGHFNKEDEILDVVLIDSVNDRMYIVLGDGNGSFSKVSTYDAIPNCHPIWLNVGDFNENNQTDLVVVNSGGNRIDVMIDYFSKAAARQKSYGLGKGLSTVTVAFCDLNNDSIVDIVFNVENIIFISMGLGNGSFNEETMYSLNCYDSVQFLCVGDLNNDDRMDLISIDYRNGLINTFFGDGNGMFSSMKNYSFGRDSQPQWLALADFNHDEVLDIVCANEGTRSLDILLGNGDGTLTIMRNLSQTMYGAPISVAVGHFDDDNDIDLVASDELGWITIFLGVGDGSFIFWREYSINMNSYYLFSVAVGHLNNDRDLDIVVADSTNNSIAILLGHGDGTFTTPSRYSTGNASIPYYVLVADFNNDNRSDIVTTNFGNDEVAILYGDGNGSFQLERIFPTGYGSKPYGIAVADFDNDQHLELAVAFWGIGKVAVLTEYMSARFINETSYSTGSAFQSVSVTIDDFNNDNQSDIVVANAGIDNLHIFFGLTLSSPISYPLDENSDPQYVITCDINEDHYPDIISVNSQTNTISVIMTYGNKTFGEQLIYSTGIDSHPSSIVADYFNNDHRLDLIVTNKGTDEIGIFFGYDYATFHDPIIYPIMDNEAPWKLIVNDFNNDTYLDLAVLFSNKAHFGVLLGHGNGTFSNMITYLIQDNSSLTGIEAKDLNNDNSIDIVIIDGNLNGSINVFLGYGNGSFAPRLIYSTGKRSGPSDVAVDDCNNDHRLDVIVTNFDGNSIGVFLGRGNGRFSSVRTTFIRNNYYPRYLAVGYFNSDRYLDVAVASDRDNSVAVLFGYGNGTFGGLFLFPMADTYLPCWIDVGDFNQDNYLDIATANFNGNSVGILLGYGNGTFDKTLQRYSTGMGSAPMCIDIDDFNNDQILDIAVANSGTNEIVILFGLGDGTFFLSKPYSTGLRSVPWALTIADLNNDSQLDIIVTNSRSKNIGIFLRYDSEPFGSMFIPWNEFWFQPNSVAIADLDHDNRSDIVVANYRSNSVGTLLEFNGIRFNRVKEYSTGIGSGPYSIALAYLNNDTHLDMVVINSESDNILLLFGYEDGSFGNETVYSTGIRSRPYSMSITDLNNDNVLDIAIVNSGTSNLLLLYGYGDGTFGNQISYSLGYGYHPYSIATKDLNNDHFIDIVIVCYDTNHLDIFMQMCL